MEPEREETRQEFEAFITAAPYQGSVERFADDHDQWPGEYQVYSTQQAWDVWRAAWARREQSHIPTTTGGYTAIECLEYAKSCIKNRDKRECTLLWLDRALELLRAGTE